MARADAGLHSEGLKAALDEALSGRPAHLEDLLSRHGGVLTPRPNLRLAAAFGAEMGALRVSAAPLLARLGGDDAAPDTDRAFLPIAAAHGWAARLRAGLEVEPAWAALAELAADERSPVRVGTLDALLTLTVREGGADELIRRGLSWLEADDRELRFGAAAQVVELLGDRRVVSGVRDHGQLQEFLSRVIDEIAGAPRSADRSEGRRRALAVLPRALAAVAADDSAGDSGRGWLQGECDKARHPDVRAALSDAVNRLRATSYGQTATTVGTLRASLEGSAKPPRDPSRIRPGTGRGKSSRRTR